MVERFIRNFEVSSQNPSGISQIVLFKLLDEHWGHSGYLDWLINLRLQYTDRRDALLHSCEKHLPTEIAHWVPPTAGMFVSEPSKAHKTNQDAETDNSLALDRD
jgi:aromatic amino acid aminotransferase I